MSYIIIKTLTGKSYFIDFQACKTYADMKKVIEDKLRHEIELPTAEQSLIFCGKKLSDDDNIDFGAHIQEECIHLVQKQLEPKEPGKWFVVDANLYNESLRSAKVALLDPAYEVIPGDHEANALNINSAIEHWENRKKKNNKNKQSSNDPSRLNGNEAFLGLIFLPESTSKTITLTEGCIAAPEGESIHYIPCAYTLPGTHVVATTFTSRQEPIRQLMEQFKETVAKHAEQSSTHLAAIEPSGQSGGGAKPSASSDVLQPQQEEGKYFVVCTNLYTKENKSMNGANIFGFEFALELTPGNDKGNSQAINDAFAEYKSKNEKNSTSSSSRLTDNPRAAHIAIVYLDKNQLEKVTFAEKFLTESEYNTINYHLVASLDSQARITLRSCPNKQGEELIGQFIEKTHQVEQPAAQAQATQAGGGGGKASSTGAPRGAALIGGQESKAGAKNEGGACAAPKGP